MGAPIVPLDRLIGIEQEYAVVHRPPPGAEHPGNRALFLAIARALSERMATQPAGGLWGWSRERLFTQTGGSLYYESLPQAVDHGLVEAATPECRGPSQALRYARAWDRLLVWSAEQAARQVGSPIVLRKNGRDAYGHVYGPQENYEVDLARGPRLWVWRAVLAVLAPLTAIAGLLHLIVVASVMMGAILLAMLAVGGAFVVAALLDAFRRDHRVSPARWADATLLAMAEVERASLTLWFGPLALVLSVAIRLCAWRPYRRRLTAFLVTRMLVSGAGTLRDDGGFALSEKADAIRRPLRWTFLSGDRGLYETGHLLKGLMGPMLLRPHQLFALFGRRQRLQLGMSDANLCEVADYLKLGTTAVLLDLVDAGRLRDAPVLRDPVAAARRVSRRGVEAPLELVDGRVLTALDIQRWYADQAAAALADDPAPSLEAHAIVTRWQRVLDDLATDRDRLVGQLDWVTKQALIDDAGQGAPWEVRKKIDLRYHDLGDGYFAWLDQAGATVRILDEGEVEGACHDPPADTPAAVRGALVHGLAGDADVRLDWSTARVWGKVIPLDRRRDDDAKRRR